MRRKEAISLNNCMTKAPCISQVATEQEVRKLRDTIYGPEAKYCTAEGWEACKANWMRPENVEWLREHQPVCASGGGHV